MDDSTFSAFLRDPEFLKTILPLTDELDMILRRVFECNPTKRITIPELRHMIMQCSAFTTRSSSTPSLVVPAQQQAIQYDVYNTLPYQEANLYPIAPQAADQYQYTPEFSNSDHGSVYSSTSSYSSCSSYGSYAQVSTPVYEAPPAPTVHYVSPPQSSWYSNLMPALDLAQKHMSFSPFLSSVRVF